MNRIGSGDRRRAIVIASGAIVDERVRAALPAGAFVVAADGGVDVARSLSLPVDVAVGDFDSASAAGLEWARHLGARLDQHPTAKDATDLELALDVALDEGATEVVVVASARGRLDHLLAVAASLVPPAERGARVSAWLDGAYVAVVTASAAAQLCGAPGDLVTLLPWHGAARGVRTEGLLYPLAGDDLPPGTSRGVSNELTAPQARVTIDAGVLLAVVPQREEPITT